jgi:hypothetical protein
MNNVRDARGERSAHRNNGAPAAGVDNDAPPVGGDNDAPPANGDNDVEEEDEGAINNIAERTSRVLGNNAGSADAIPPLDHRASSNAIAVTMLWMWTTVNLLAPPAIESPGTSHFDMRDTVLALGTRAVHAELKNPFLRFNLRSRSFYIPDFLTVVANTMENVFNHNWIDDVRSNMQDPEEQTKRQTVNDIIHRQKDAMAAMTWALFIMDQPVPYDFQTQGGRGLLKALPSLYASICAATANESAATRTNFKTVSNVAKNLDKSNTEISRKRKD